MKKVYIVSMKKIKKSSKYKTGADAFKIFPYDEYHVLIITWFKKWYGYDSDRISDIAESYFGYEVACKNYDNTIGVPFIAYLKQTIKSHMQKYYQYNDDLIHVPLLKRDEDKLTIIDGDQPITENSTIFDFIPDDKNDLNNSFEYADIVKQLPEIIEIVRKKRRQSICKDLVYDKFLDLADSKNRAGDVSAIAEATGVSRQLISINVQKIKLEVISELKKRGIQNPFIGEE